MAKEIPNGSVGGLCSSAATIASLGLAFFGVWAYTNATPGDTWEPRELWVIAPVLLSFLCLTSTTLLATWPYDREALKAGKVPRSMRAAWVSFLLGAVLAAFSVGMVIRLDWPASPRYAQGTHGSNSLPLAFGPGQTIIDLNKLVWAPLEAEGVPRGPEIAVLRGDEKAAGFEAVVRLPAYYTFPNHSHTSGEHYVWLKGDFTYIAADGTTTPLSGQTYIGLPGGVPHALACGSKPCMFYVRYPQPFDAHIHPMPPLKQ